MNTAKTVISEVLFLFVIIDCQ